MTNNKLLFLTLGILIGFGGAFLIKNQEPVNNADKIVFMNSEGNTLSVDKPSFLKNVSMKSQGYAESEDSMFEFFTADASEPTLPLCETEQMNDQELIDDCTWEKHENDGSTVNVIYKDGKIRQAAYILVDSYEINSSIQIDKRNKNTQKSEFFTDQEVTQWLNVIKNW
jgi:hypothetical protein